MIVGGILGLVKIKITGGILALIGGGLSILGGFLEFILYIPLWDFHPLSFFFMVLDMPFYLQFFTFEAIMAVMGGIILLASRNDK